MTGGLNAGTVTVDGKQWTRIAVCADIPVWKFGVGLDVELFLDDKGNVSDKGWQFNPHDKIPSTILRKIRYLRFNHETDKVFAKVGEPVTSAVLVQAGAPEKGAKRKLRSTNANVAWEAFKAINARLVARSEWRQAFDELSELESANSKKQAFSRAVVELLERGEMVEEQPGIYELGIGF